MPNDKGPWCPTRGYLSDSATPPAPAADAGAPAETAAAAPVAAAAPAGGGGGGGKSLWTPARGYIGGGGGGAAVPAAAPAAAAASADSPATAPAAPVAKTATTKAEKKPAAAAAKPKKIEADPERESITTIESLAEHKAFGDLAGHVYTEPDSETTLYKVPALNIFFALSSLALLITTLMVFWQDYDRQWKTIQADWRETLIVNYEEEREGIAEKQLSGLIDVARGLEKVLEKVDEARAETVLPSLYPGIPDEGSQEVVGESALRRLNQALQRITSLREEVRDALEDEEEYGRLEKAFIDASTEAEIHGKETRAFRGDMQAEKFNFEEEKKHLLEHGLRVPGAVEAVTKREDRFNEQYMKPLTELDRRLEELLNTAEEAQKEFDNHVKERTETTLPTGEGAAKKIVTVDFAALESSVDTLVYPVDTVTGRLTLIEHSWRNATRNAPLVDFMAPTYKIDKVVTPDLHEPLNFLTVERVHRCKSCHVNIVDASASVVSVPNKKWGSVYESHPRLDLFLSAASPHNYEEFGCTTCHYGDGHALEFTLASHTPGDRHQEEEWHEKYDYHELHHQDFPMLPTRFISSSCVKCHEEQRRIEGADRLNRGAELVRTYGCFGCHKIKGYEVAAGNRGEPGADKDLDRVWKLERVGPNLKHVADKTSFDFLRRWVRQPSHFRSSTRMPQFFDLSNTRGTMKTINKDNEQAEVDFNARNGVEVLALATYLQTASEPRELRDVTEKGDPARGRLLVKSLGCLGCHSVKVETESVDDEPLPGLADVSAALKVAATAQEAVDNPQRRQLARAYRGVVPTLDELFRWLDKLTVGVDIETLYHRSRVAIERAIKLEGSLELEESAMETPSRLAKSVYDRWVHNTFGPDLSTLARKFDLSSQSGRKKAERWLADWIVDPIGHDPSTIMPSLRIEKDPDGDQKVADIVSYLLTLDYNAVDYAALPGARPKTLDGADAQKARDDVWKDGVGVLTQLDIERRDDLGEILDEIAFDHLRRNHSTNEAKRLLDGDPNTDPMTVSNKLIYVGHRLVRRYGCFACHNGIKDKDPDPDPPEQRDPSLPIAYFDTAQPIGAELNKWGNKDAEKLDYGQWGHQHDGSLAIGHNRFAWAAAKLSDTRRFDVLPDPRSIGHGEVAYSPSDRLIQKTPEELLKMPRFPFHDDPEQVEDVVNFLISLVNDPIRPQRKKMLDTRERILEAGSRLVEKLNCSGCHRLGATTQFVHVDDLPNPTGVSDEESRTNIMEPETWLARELRVIARPLGDRKNALLGMPLPADFPLSLEIGQYVPAEVPKGKTVPEVFSENEDSMTVVDAARRHFDPLPGFIRDLAMAIASVSNGEVEPPPEKKDGDESKDESEEEDEVVTTANIGIFRWVRSAMTSDSKDPTIQLIPAMRTEYENDDNPSALGDFLYAVTDENPYTMDLESWFQREGVDKRTFEALAMAYYGDVELPFTRYDERRIAVKGFREGGVRFYSGTQGDYRYKAPPPLLRQGERVYSDWMFHFLLDVRPIRPWLTIRMPSFRLSQEEARLLVKWFKVNAGVPYGDEIFEVDTLDRATARSGRDLFGKSTGTVKGKECSGCHPRGSTLPSSPFLVEGRGTITPDEVPLYAPGESYFLVWKGASGTVFIESGFSSIGAAIEAGKTRFTDESIVWAAGNPWDKSGWGPDLSEAAARLRPQWMREWLYYPSDFMPGTKMPNFFDPDGKRTKFHGRRDEHVNDDTKKEVDALLQYIKHMNTIDVASEAPKATGTQGGGGQ